MQKPELMAKIKSAPMQPGCYLYRDSMSNVIYVGKAKVLRNRVRQYFQKRRAGDDPKLDALVRAIADVEYQIALTERDALMLEYRLIKQYKPWFNSQLVSDPRQVFLRIDRQTSRPTLTISESVLKDGADYFGYFKDQYAAQGALVLLNSTWRTPVCGRASFASPTRPCVHHEIGRCMAPCGQSLDQHAYRAAVDEIVNLLSGTRTDVFGQLDAEMKCAAAALDFERAAAIKQQSGRLERLRRRNRFLSSFPEKGDVLVFMRAFREPEFSVFLVRDGSATARWDLRGVPDKDAILAGAQIPPDSGWIPNCLIELYADKLFTSLPDGTNLSAMIRNGAEQFLAISDANP